MHPARTFAIDRHGGQCYGDRPYVWHLDAVVALLEPHGEPAITIGYLHDVVEDTAATVADIEQAFGPLVAAAVQVLTDADGPDRRTRKARTYERMAAVDGELTVALLVKAADRLANIQACVADGRRDKLAMYAAEHAAFRTAVHRPGLCDGLWAAMDASLATTGA